MISIHAPPRGATNRRDARPAVPTFQFTPLREGRHARLARHQRLFRHFNSRPSARGDDSETTRSRSVSISIHAPPRGATFCGFPTTFPLQISIHAPPRGATKPDPPQSGGSPISIHAPPRGATSRALLVARKLHLFQFTPLREGRLLALTCLPMAFYFNSRPSARGDHAAGFAGFGVCISIHAPPRGATLRSFETDFSPSHFNSRPSARGDGASSIVKALASYFNSRPSARGDGGFPAPVPRHSFQFTPLREGRPAAPCFAVVIVSDFNSRPSARGDANVQPLLLGNKFQFTPLREGRQRSSRQIRRACYFNSRPSARGDSTKSRASSGSTNFNSRPSARGDFCSSGRTWVSAISIHAPPRGATPPSHPPNGRSVISIHAPPRGATRSRC